MPISFLRWMDGAQWYADMATAVARTDVEKALAELLAVMATEARAKCLHDPDEHTAPSAQLSRIKDHSGIGRCSLEASVHGTCSQAIHSSRRGR
jgi:hypothetical protein